MGRAGTVLLAGAVAVAGFAAVLPVLGWDVDDLRGHAHKTNVTLSAGAVPDTRVSDLPCEGGFAGPFSCDGVDLLGFVPAAEFAGPETDLLTSDDVGPDGVAGISDIWGWTDPIARPDGVHDEYVIIGKTNGVGFFRVTDPFAPEYLGELPNTSPIQLVWHDMKVYRDHVFVVSESAAHGMQVFDLRQLRGASEDAPQVFLPTSHYPLDFAAHNIAINEQTGFAYLLGENIGIVAQSPCSLHIVDISSPALPRFAGCWSGERLDLLDLRIAEYVHDAQCTIYRGPDTDHQGKEICFAADEINVSIIDVTDKLNPVVLGQTDYTDVAYSHQGWLSEDHRFLFHGDELDEVDFGLNTRTVVFDVRDLDNPVVHFEHLHDTIAPDHNMYTVGAALYQSNYAAGLRVLDTTFVEDLETLSEIAFFDTFPADDDDPLVSFDGTWSNYPFFDSGTIAVSGRGEGLFLLRVQEEALQKIGKRPGGPPPGSEPPPGSGPPLGPPATQQVFYAIGCVTAPDGSTCETTTFDLSAEPGEDTVGTLGSLTPLNEAIFVLEGSEPTTQFGVDDTLADAYTLRTDEPISGQITLRSLEDAGVGLTTVYVEVTGVDADGRRVLVGDATVTQPMLPGGPTVFEFTIEPDPALDGLTVQSLASGVAVRGANVLAGFTDGQGGSFFTLPFYG